MPRGVLYQNPQFRPLPPALKTLGLRVHKTVSSGCAVINRLWDYTAGEPERSPLRSARQQPPDRPQHQRASPFRPRLCRHQSQLAGPYRRTRSRSRRYQCPPRPSQLALRICLHFPRQPRGHTLHRRHGKTRPAARSRRVEDLGSRNYCGQPGRTCNGDRTLKQPKMLLVWSLEKPTVRY
jgi:hypothetical protein